MSDSEGRAHAALQMLERALALAEPEDYVRVFLDEGLPMLALLRQAAGPGIQPGYIRRLMEAAGSGRAIATPTAAASAETPLAAWPALIEPL